jgi:DMSO/TMAO reductase YedYZ molybdopterin-dependent catalytic subunit
VVHLVGLPGTARRFTGSYETGSFTPAMMPNTIWLDDTAPVLDPSDWRLEIVDGDGHYSLGPDDLATLAQTWRETLDCTSGWYAHQDWTGAPVSRLLRSVGPARSLLAHSVTGYWVRIPVRDLDTLLLATDVAGEPLSVGHGYPLRLVAPGRRGYWWVKWVDRIELQREKIAIDPCSWGLPKVPTINRSSRSSDGRVLRARWRSCGPYAPESRGTHSTSR